MTYFHGARVVTMREGFRPVQTVTSAIIGVVGTASKSAPAIKAKDISEDAEWIVQAITAGKESNGIVFETIVPSAVSQTLRIETDITEGKITCYLATDGAGLPTTTIALLKTAVAADEVAKLYVEIVGVKAETAKIGNDRLTLEGGEDEPFPLNTPVAITTLENQKIDKLGIDGTLKKSLQIMAKFGTCTCIVVRVEEGSDRNKTTVNIAGDAVAGTGIFALKKSQNKTGIAPKILIAPWYSEEKTVADNLLSVANNLYAYTYLDIKHDATIDEAIAARRLLTSSVGMITYPYQRFINSNVKRTETAPLSVFIAAARSKADNENGWHTTVSSQPIIGSLGSVIDIDYTFGDSNNIATRLNENHITTIVNMGDGNVFFGCRSLTEDTQEMFEQYGRARGIVYDSLIRSHKWAVDRNINTHYAETVVDGVNDFLSRLTSAGYILNGRCWADPELNTKGSIQLGQFFFNFDYAIAPPAEQLTFNAYVNSDYYGEIIQ